ncbi:disease resistance protein RPM1-like [Carex rostrata]
MAESAILAALRVLGDLTSEIAKLAISKFSKLCSTYKNLEANIHNISSELRVMQGFLDGIEMDDQSNKPQVAWIKEVHELANHIEDIVSEFAYLINNQKFDGISIYVTKLFKDPKLLVDLKRVASQLLVAETRLVNLARMKERWVPTTNVSTGENSNYSNEYSYKMAISAHFIHEDQIVGIKNNSEKLTSWLNSKKPELSVISVWGMGGVGKTTLVTNVFKREKNNFDCHAWINISQYYTVENLVQNMISEICKEGQINSINTGNKDLRELKEIMVKLLKEKKYLIVLDDMWDLKAFQDIRDTLVNDHRGSRIMITSRIANVASLAPERNRLELKPLPELDSWDLFCKKAFPIERNYECPPPLKKWAKEIVSKCDGLPLALVSLGGVLSCSEKTESEWRRVHDQLTWELDNNPNLDPLKNILNLSFKYLPKYLKNCFLHCSLFAEDFRLPRKKLLRLWIAEGFIQQKGRSTLEEVAEGYLMDLIHRSMLQVVEKNYFGRVKRCQMHDTLRECAISLCKRENFGLMQEDNNSENAHSSTRRLSITNLRDTVNHDVCLPKLRTFLSVDNDVPSSPLLSMIFDKSRYLTVVDLEGLPIETVPNAIGDLFNLNYLGLRHTMVKSLPKSIKKLYNLQTLDLFCSQIQTLPDGIAELRKLRHLFAEVEVDPTYRSFRTRTGMSLPRGIFYLKDLQTIQSLESNAMVVRELGNLTQLRSFRIYNVKENQSVELCKSLSKMSFLSLVNINASDEEEILQLDGLNLPQLQKLCLYGKLKETMLESPLFKISGDSIQMLRLGWSQLQNDPLPSLSHCRNLTFLHLKRAYEGQRLIFQAGWFPKLKSLGLEQMSNLIQVEMEQGTMATLEEIWLWELKQLVEVPKGIEHLVSLKWMGCRYMPVDFGGLAEGTHQLFHFTCRVFTFNDLSAWYASSYFIGKIMRMSLQNL